VFGRFSRALIAAQSLLSTSAVVRNSPISTAYFKVHEKNKEEEGGTSRFSNAQPTLMMCEKL